MTTNKIEKIGEKVVTTSGATNASVKALGSEITEIE